MTRIYAIINYSATGSDWPYSVQIFEEDAYKNVTRLQLRTCSTKFGARWLAWRLLRKVRSQRAKGAYKKEIR